MTSQYGWKTVRLDEVCDFNPKHFATIDRRLPVSFLPMPAIDTRGNILPHNARLLTDVWKGYTHFAEGDVLFAKITPCMENGKIAVARNLMNGLGCGTTEFHVLRTRGEILPEFLQKFLWQESFRNGAETSMTGAVGQRRVPLEFLKSFELALPPLPVQQLIVDKLDGLFHRTNTIRQELERIPKLIGRYKQVILNNAFQCSNSGNGSWEEVQLGDLLEGIDAGKNLKCEERPPGQNERGVVKVSAVTWGVFNPMESKTLPASFSPDPKTLITAGDFLISRANTIELVGACVLVSEAPANLYLSDKILRLRVSNELKPWLLWFLRSSHGRRQIEDFSTGNQLAMRNISQGSIKSIRVPLPPPEVRASVVQDIETRLRAMTTVGVLCSKLTKMVHQLEQRTLNKAFAGDLIMGNLQNCATTQQVVLNSKVDGSRAVIAGRGAPKGHR